MGGAIITTIEFFAGVLFNLHFGMKIWDYGDMPFNLLGQICPEYAIVWVGVAALGLIISRGLQNIFQYVSELIKIEELSIKSRRKDDLFEENSCDRQA